MFPIILVLYTILLKLSKNDEHQKKSIFQELQSIVTAWLIVPMCTVFLRDRLPALLAGRIASVLSAHLTGQALPEIHE